MGIWRLLILLVILLSCHRDTLLLTKIVIFKNFKRLHRPFLIMLYFFNILVKSARQVFLLSGCLERVFGVLTIKQILINYVQQYLTDLSQQKER